MDESSLQVNCRVLILIKSENTFLNSEKFIILLFCYFILAVANLFSVYVWKNVMTPDLAYRNQFDYSIVLLVH